MALKSMSCKCHEKQNIFLRAMGIQYFPKETFLKLHVFFERMHVSESGVLLLPRRGMGYRECDYRLQYYM